jgi:hypothetical protein
MTHSVRMLSSPDGGKPVMNPHLADRGCREIDFGDDQCLDELLQSHGSDLPRAAAV